MTYEEIKRAAQAAKKKEQDNEGRHSLTLTDLSRIRRLRGVGEVVRKANSERLTAIYGGGGAGAKLSASTGKSEVKRLASDAVRERNADRELIAKKALRTLG